jgi:hypothetical protein
MQLAEAGSVLAQRPADPHLLDDVPTGLPAEFEALRWFALPNICLSPT